MKRLACILACSYLLFSCHEVEQPDLKPESKISVNESDSLISTSLGGKQFSLIVAKSLINEGSFFKSRTNFGDAELFINPKFHLYISEESTDMAALKKELSEDGLFDHKFYSETDNELLYQPVLPDGTEMPFQWVKTKNSNGKQISIKTDAQGSFSKQDIRTMQKCIETLNIK